MQINIENQTFEDISAPNHNLPSHFNIIKEETNNDEFYYREISLSHVVIEITILVPDNLNTKVTSLD